MIEPEMPQLNVVAEPDLSAQQAISLPESNSDLRVRSWVESDYSARAVSPIGTRARDGDSASGLKAEERAN